MYKAGEEICSVVQKKDKPIDWRPRAHHILHNKDSHFDSRFNAYLRCEMYLTQLYCTVIQSSHSNLVGKLANDIKNSTTRTSGASSSSSSSLSSKAKTPIYCISSALSNPDCDVFAKFMLQFFCTHLCTSIAIDSQCNNSTSAHDLLTEVAENLFLFIEDKQRSEKRTTASSSVNTSKQSNSNFTIRLLQDMPVKAILNLITTFQQKSGTHLSLIIIMRNIERVDNEVFGEFIELIHSIEGLHVSLITLNNSLCNLPLRLDKSVQSLVDVSILGTTKPWEIYDDFTGKVVSSRELPVSLPPKVWGWIHETFWRSSCCVKSALDMILLGLSHHFSKRRSLLCMFEETKWLSEMKLVVKKGGKSHDEKIHGAISEILAYMGGDDISGTGLRLARADITSRNSEVNFAKRILIANLSRTRIDKAWFKCLRECRDKFLSHSGQRMGFCSDIIWAALKSPKKKDKMICGVEDLVETIGKNMSKVPICIVHQLIQHCSGLLANIDVYLETIYDSMIVEESEELAASGTKYKINSWTKTKSATLDQFISIKSDLDDHFLVFEETLETMRSFNILPTTSQAELPRKEGSAKRSKSKQNLVKEFPSAKKPSEFPTVYEDNKVDNSSSYQGDRAWIRDGLILGDNEDMNTDSVDRMATSTSLFKSPAMSENPMNISGKVEEKNEENMIKSPVANIRSMSEKAASPSSKAMFSSPVIHRQNNQVNASPMSGGSRLASLQSPTGTMYEGSMFTFIEIAIEDFVGWLRDASAFFQTIPRPDPTPGILDMTEEAVTSTLSVANGNIRSVYMEALTDPEKYESIKNGSPDISILSDIVFKSLSTANIFDWFDLFKSTCQTWDLNKNRKKRKRQQDAWMNETNAEMVILKCRFVKALSDLEKFGIVKVKNGGTEVRRIAYMWMMNSD